MINNLAQELHFECENCKVCEFVGYVFTPEELRELIVDARVKDADTVEEVLADYLREAEGKEG